MAIRVRSRSPMRREVATVAKRLGIDPQADTHNRLKPAGLRQTNVL